MTAAEANPYDGRVMVDAPDNRSFDLPPQLAFRVLRSALELHPGPALLVDSYGGVHLANQAGAAFLDALECDVKATILTLLAEGEQDGWTLRRQTEAGPQLYLLSRPARVEDPVTRAARDWKLSRRQAQILGLIAQGYSNKEIALHCGCAESTAEIHVSAILRKAGVGRRAQLIALLR